MEEEEEEEITAVVHGRRGRRDGEVLAPDQGKWGLENRLFLFLESDNSLSLGVHLSLLQVDATASSIPELERQIEKLSKVLCF